MTTTTGILVLSLGNLLGNQAYLDGLIARKLHDPGKLIILKDRCIREGMRAAQFDARVVAVRKADREIRARDRKEDQQLNRTGGIP